jgi:orotidine-5'-phosphate decarboxylase
MNTHFADRLMHAIREKNSPACVGFDPLVERFPGDLLRDAGVKLTRDGELEGDTSQGAIAEALVNYGGEVIRLVAPHVPVIKINIAFFERYGPEGVRVYFDLVKLAQDTGLIVIGDVKRADIGHTSMQYAHAHLGDLKRVGLTAPDAITVNAYFGLDAIRPFIDVARDAGRGLFVLVQTSNPSAAEVQNVPLSDGSILCHHMAHLVQTWASGEGLVGASNYSCVGAVVSPRDIESTIRIRELMPNCIFLVPGFGAQGRTAGEVAKCFNADGTGAIVNASRSVIYAYQDERYRDACGDNWRAAIEQSCRDLIAAIRGVVGG